MKRLLALLPALAVALFAVPGAAQRFAGTPPVAAFADTLVPLRLTERQLRDGALIRVLRADSAVTLHFGIDDAGAAMPLSRLVSVDSAIVHFARRRDVLQPHHDVRLVLRSDTVRRGERLPPGSYRGWVTIADTSGRIGARREVEVRVPGVEPFAGTWQADIFKLSAFVERRARWFPWGELRCDVGRASASACVRDNVLPLRVPPGLADPGTRAPGGRVDLRQYELLGTLQHAKGDNGLVWWTREPLRGDSMRAGMVLHFTSFDVPGSYSGKITLGSAGDTTVAMAVRVTHDWPVPLVVLTLGILLSWMLQRYVRSRRATLMLDSDIGRLLHRIEIVDARLAEADSQRAGALPYRIPDHVRWEIQEAEQRLRRATRLRRADEADKATAKATEALAAWEAELARWERFAAGLNDVATALAAARVAAAPIRPIAASADPSVLVCAEELLAGRPLAGQAIDDTRQELDVSLSLLQSWTEVALQIGPAASLRPDAVDALWAAGSLQEIAAVAAPPAPGAAAGGGGGVSESRSTGVLLDVRRVAGAARRVWLPAPVVSEASLLTRVRRAEKRELSNAIGYQVLTFLVVALTGLSQVYHGEPVFGTAGDYLEALLWGFSGKLGIDFLRDVLTNREFPWPKWRERQAPPTQPVDGEYPV